MNSEDRLLFLRYALPCASTLVRRGKVSQDSIDSLIKVVSEGKKPPEDTEKIFVVANTMCNKIAKGMGKNGVDSEVVRTYFLFEHSDVVNDRFELMKDFNPVYCKTYPGKVISRATDSAIVETILGRKNYKTIFADKIKAGDEVVVHYDYIIERINKETVKKMKLQMTR